MIRISETSVLKRISFLVFVFLAAGCSLEKQSALNRGLQNLTAHYNILFNANELIGQKQDSYAVSFVDSYNEILNVYQDTTSQSGTSDKDLAEAKLKATKIINIKEQSHYIGDAYLVLGKASYLDGDYFQAVEFFSYVIRSFPKKTALVQQALVWKARSMLYINQLPQAKLVIDSAIESINPKKKAFTGDIYATKLQYDIAVQDYADAETAAKQAIHYCRNKAQRLRWTFILAQIQELNNKTGDAVKNYTRIVKSNAAFEMAFNADLNRIRIEDNQNGVKINRIDRLRNLLKNENNKEFIDQIYYQIAQLYLVNKDIDNAVKNYRLSVRHSAKNQNQKGLSYLRIADIYFKNKADYVGAKKYYDSTLLAMSPNYPGYQAIQKKSNNLQLLADRYGIISREDTLQMLAQLDEKTRAGRIDALVNRQILQQQAASVATPSADIAGSGGLQSGGAFGSSFYFYNSNAVSQGYNDFKQRWGNRKLEDNWRRSNKASSDITSSAAPSLDPFAPSDQPSTGKNTTSAGNYRQQLIKDLPLSPELLVLSNTRIYNAYFEIANFYRDILGDKKEAIAIYELLLSRFPNTADGATLYYNLYRLYSDGDTARSDEYKRLLLKNYAQTPYAKIIVDPEYGKKLNDADAGLNTLYNQVYDNYSKKKYQDAITGIDELARQYPDNKLSAQLAYLRAISSGHLENLALFRKELAGIITRYPDDRLVTPLVRQHLAYIDAHQTEMQAGQYALTNNDPDEVPFKGAPTPQEQIAAYNNSQLVGQAPQQRINPVTKKPETAPAVKNQAATIPVASGTEAAKPAPSLFSMRDSTDYYFVVNVNSSTTNLASSRFGIGQFNRANFESGAIKHQLMNVGEDTQLIYVGRFYSIDAVKSYARAIIPLMPDIMKVPKDKYSFFIITQENLDKLTDKTKLDKYIDFYQNNY
ncbi:MAG: tetratricopeptide repeat protein [Mucilaginibacter sp.]|nr:tetratricopeptide repeat protein [Mucilaginibacter sp.]